MRVSCQAGIVVLRSECAPEADFLFRVGMSNFCPRCSGLMPDNSRQIELTVPQCWDLVVGLAFVSIGASGGGVNTAGDLLAQIYGVLP